MKVCQGLHNVALILLFFTMVEGFSPKGLPDYPKQPTMPSWQQQMNQKQQPPPPTSTSAPSLPAPARLFSILASISIPALVAFRPVLAAPGADQKPTLEEVSRLQERAFTFTNRFQFAEADKVWTELIDVTGGTAAAWSNRGNCRTSLGRCSEALEDFNKAISLAPEEPDPYLGRGVSEECLKRYEDATKDYETANAKNLLKTGREDPVTYNNRANALAGLGRWQEALDDYNLAARMQPDYVFPKGSAALTTYQLGDEKSAIKQMKLLLIKYPTFVDMRAALAVLYWKEGELGKAETEWVSVVNEDPRYRRLAWVRDVRKWPPRMVDALDNFLALKLTPPAVAAAPTTTTVPPAAVP